MDKAENKTLYECLYIVDSSLGEDGVRAVIDRIGAILEASSAVESVNEWGTRKLAYPIDDLTEGYYVLVRFESAPDFPAELDRNFNITDGILRSLIIKVGD